MITSINGVDKIQFEMLRERLKDNPHIIDCLVASLGVCERTLDRWCQREYKKTLKQLLFKGVVNGRPKKEVDMTLLARCCRISKNQQQAAYLMGIDKATISRRLQEEHNISFARYFDEYRGQYKMNLMEEADHQVFKLHDTHMTKFLLKNVMGMSDKVETTTHIDDRRDPLSESIMAMVDDDNDLEEEEEFESDEI